MMKLNFVSKSSLGRSRIFGEGIAYRWQFGLVCVILNRCMLHLRVSVLQLVQLEHHSDKLLRHGLCKSFTQANTMAAKERSIGVWVPGTTIWCLKVLRVDVKAIRNVLVMQRSPVPLIVMQKAIFHMQLLACPDLELLLSSLG